LRPDYQARDAPTSTHPEIIMPHTPASPSVCDPVTFTRRGFGRGFRLCLSLGLSVAAYGVVYGVLARQAGVTPVETMLTSLFVFAGASQLVVLDLWSPTLPMATIILTVLVVNLRHVLMGAAMRDWLACLPPRTAYGTLYFMTDESWALSLREMGSGGKDAGFFLGAGLCIYLCWFSATCIGLFAGSAVSDPARWGLDFAFTGVFLALLVGLWKGKSDLLPWGVAGLAALAAYHLLPGKWYIICGGLAGGLCGALLAGRSPRPDSGAPDGR
jgi:4-azaleucine resistance transporter AzlC